MIQFAVAFVVLSLAFVIIYVMLDAVKSGLLGSAGADRRRMEKQIELGNAALDKVKEIEKIKRRFFSNLMSAISEPLLAITGQLKTAARDIDGGHPAGKPLSFALNEAEQLRYLVSDYEKIEIFRQSLVPDASTILSVSEIVEQVSKDSVLHQRFPQFKVITQISGNLPSTRGDNDLIVRALGNLVAYAAQQSGQGEVIFTASQDDDQWLLLTLTGSAFAGASAPSNALLDESRQFLAQIEHGSGSVGNYKSLVGVVLAKLILENFGGSLDVGSSDAPGFVLRLPANQQ
jgi:signal transduction histidine kinase